MLGVLGGMSYTCSETHRSGRTMGGRDQAGDRGSFSHAFCPSSGGNGLGAKRLDRAVESQRLWPGQRFRGALRLCGGVGECGGVADLCCGHTRLWAGGGADALMRNAEGSAWRSQGITSRLLIRRSESAIWARADLSRGREAVNGPAGTSRCVSHGIRGNSCSFRDRHAGEC